MAKQTWAYSTVHREFLPYCMQQMADKRWIILNRRYKPLGQQNSDHVDYEKHPSLCQIRITASIRSKLDIKGSKIPTPHACAILSHAGIRDCFWLYVDDRDLTPNSDYWQKIALLASLKIWTSV